MNDLFLKHIKSMMHSPVHNYIIPGLSSWKLGESSDKGMVRLFSCERDHQEAIVPHSHRYDFFCMVIDESVENLIWYESENGDPFMVSSILYKDNIGKYEQKEQTVKLFKPKRTYYEANQVYGMKTYEIHSIKFKKGSMVLFFEGEEKTKETFMLEPYVNGKTIKSGVVMDWMFERE